MHAWEYLARVTDFAAVCRAAAWEPVFFFFQHAHAARRREPGWLRSAQAAGFPSTYSGSGNPAADALVPLSASHVAPALFLESTVMDLAGRRRPILPIRLPT